MRRLLEVDEIDGQLIGRSESQTIAVVRDDLIAKSAAEPMQRLAKRIAGFVLIDVAPEQINQLVAARLAANGEIAQQSERFAPTKTRRSAPRLVSETGSAEHAQSKRSGRDCRHVSGGGTFDCGRVTLATTPVMARHCRLHRPAGESQAEFSPASMNMRLWAALGTSNANEDDM